MYPVIEGEKDDQPELDFATDAAAESAEEVPEDTKRFLDGIEKMLKPYDGYGAADAVLKPRSARHAGKGRMQLRRARSRSAAEAAVGDGDA